MTPTTRRALLTVSYLAGHIVCAAACVGIVVVVPMIIMIVVAVVGSDPGGPLFWPVFLALLIASGIFLAALLSFSTLLTDLIRLRWAFSRWLVPPAIYLVAAATLFYAASDTLPLWVMFLLPLLAALLFTVYWLSITVAWMVPRFLLQVLPISKTKMSEQSGPDNPRPFGTSGTADAGASAPPEASGGI